MDYLKLILALSIVLQFIAAGFALMLIPITRHKTAWILISIALCLMGTRRLIGMLGLMDGLHQYIFIMELVAVAISVLMVLGVIRIKEHFLSVNRMSRQKSHLDQIAENTSDFVATITPEGIITYLNTSAREMIGVPPDGSADPQSMALIFPPKSLELIQREAIPTARRQKVWKGIMRMQTVDGGKALDVSQVLIAHPPDPEGEIVSFSTIARDVTDSVQLQKSLEEVSRSRERLLAIVAHDLRGPIGNSLSLIHMMRQQIASSTPEEISADLHQIEKSLSRNHSLMKDLLQWTRGQGDQISIEPESFDVIPVIRDLLKETADPIQQKALHLEDGLPETLKIRADESIARTVLRNLIGNAAKFTPQGGTIALATRDGSGKTVLSVKDTGPGIPEELRAKILKGIPVTSRQGSIGEPGNGLGLSLCHSLVEKMKSRLPEADLHVADTGPGGTTMELVLPNG